mmetsp:Transcript_15304/g.2551  ORF Transcript_15304/g.2551 Transcript_15304/m.2551 type:complete len:84 (+) Transcript_15304:391-642(+)
MIYSIFLNKHPNHFGKIIASVETCFSLGVVLGPLVGSIIYEHTDYVICNVIIAAMTIFSGLISYITIGKINEQPPTKTSVSMS